MHRYLAIIASLGLFYAVAGPAAASGAECRHIQAREAGEKRVALVIGNGAYGNGLPALANPARDAEAVSAALDDLGFELFVAIDLGEAELKDCLAQATRAAARASVGLVYYSGHGIQISEENYIVASDAGSDLKHGFIAVQPMVDAFQKQAAATLIVLDACRTNPLARQGTPGLAVATGRSLARIEEGTAGVARPLTQARGLLVAYSTSPNAVAADGTGRLSPFTGAFVKAVRRSGHSLQRVLTEVTRSVGEETAGAQTPWTRSSLTEELMLNGALTREAAGEQSRNWATKSTALLNAGDRRGAIAAALKGLPAQAGDAILAHFPEARLSLYTAVASLNFKLPLKALHNVELSTGDGVALFPVEAMKGGDLELWSKSRQARIAGLGRMTMMMKMVMSRDGAHLIAFDGLTATVWDARTGERRYGLEPDGKSRLAWKVHAASFSPDERLLAVAASRQKSADAVSEEEGIYVLDAMTGRQIARLAAGQVDKAFAKQGTRVGTFDVAFGSNDNLCFSFSNVAAETFNVGHYDLGSKTAKVLTSLQGVVTGTLLCAENGGHLVLASLSGTQGSHLYSWDLASGRQVLDLDEMVMPISIKPDGTLLRATNGLGAVTFYDLARGGEARLAGVPPGYVPSYPLIGGPGGNPVGVVLGGHPALDWPDLPTGAALLGRAEALLTPEERAEVERARIAYREVAAAR